MKKWLYLFCVLLPMSGFQTAWAQELPRALASAPQIKVVAYRKDVIVPIQATTFINTQVIFGKNEAILDIQSGDPDAWTFNIDQYLRNVLNIKPTVLGSNTDLDVTTESTAGKRRYYRFQLISRKQPITNAKKQTYAIQFVYPAERRAQLIARLHTMRLEKKAILNAPKDPRAYNWDYSFHGSRSIMPLHVFDDGRFTYLQLRPGQVVPAIFAVHNKAGKESVVNYRRVGQYLVIQQVAPQFTLRDGKYAVASIFNERLIAQRRHYR